MKDTITITPELVNFLADHLWLYYIAVKESDTTFDHILRIGKQWKSVSIAIDEKQAKWIRDLMKQGNVENKSNIKYEYNEKTNEG